MSRATTPIRRGLAAVAALLLFAGFVRLAVETPLLLLVTALLPAALSAALVVRLDRTRPAAWRLQAGAFLWGAVVAPALAVGLNEALRSWLGSVDPSAAAGLTARVGAPVIEEAAKAAALAVLVLLRRDAVRDARDGLVYGALVGLGFTMAENLYYFALAALAGGAAGLMESIYLRAAVGGLIHAVFTASSGAGIGAACAASGAARRAALVVAGFALAVAQHAAWNSLGAAWLDGAACAPGAVLHCELGGRLFYWLLVAPVIVALFIGPGLAALLWIGRRARPGRAHLAEAEAPR
ncbi:MAG: PrsW family glutamic-type intramembrane protease [bacterium]